MADEADLASEREEMHRRAALDKTLMQRIATGDGTCRVCGDPVEAERLDTLPGAVHCAFCAAEVEEGRQRAAKIGVR